MWGRNKNRKHGFLIRLFSWLIYTPIQYQCQLLLRILTGLNWFACEIVLVIFKLNSCLSDQTLYQYLVQAVQMMYLDCCHCSSTDSKHNHFKVPWECVECNYNNFMILMMFFFKKKWIFHVTITKLKPVFKSGEVLKYYGQICLLAWFVFLNPKVLSSIIFWVFMKVFLNYSNLVVLFVIPLGIKKTLREKSNFC